MFKISKKVRRLSNEEKDQYKKDGYLTGLPVFSSEANDDLSNFFVSLSKKVDNKININHTAQGIKLVISSINYAQLLKYLIM